LTTFNCVLIVVFAIFYHALASNLYKDLPANYMSLKANIKLGILFDNIMSDNNRGASWPSTFSMAALVYRSDSSVASRFNDTMAPGRLKLIHSVASVGKAKIVFTNRNKYTGLFQKLITV